MRIYCPHTGGAWADWVSDIWAAEYIKTHLPEAIICIDDNGIGFPQRTVDANIHNWADEFMIQEDQSFGPTDYDYMLCTHYRGWDGTYSSGLHLRDKPYKKIFFDGYGLILKFILEDWYPSFSPTKALLKQFEKLNLPDEYNVVHYSKCCYGERNKYSFEDFLKIYEWIWKDKKNVISTGKPIPGCIDLQKITGMLKIYVMMKAKEIYVSETGFTMIASMYRRRKESYLIDADRIECGLPHCYTNVEFTGDLKPVYYYLENHPFEDYFNWCRTDGSSINNKTTNNIKGFYPDFEITKDESPPDYIPKKVYLDIENCPFPYNYKIKYTEIDKKETYDRHYNHSNINIQ